MNYIPKTIYAASQSQQNCTTSIQGDLLWVKPDKAYSLGRLRPAPSCSGLKVCVHIVFFFFFFFQSPAFFFPIFN